MRKYKLALALVFAAGPAQAARRAPRPGADALLLKMLSGPATGYAAVERVQVFLPGRKPKAIKVGVTGLPGGLRRLEVLAKKKKAPALVQVRGAGQYEAPETGLARLRALYEIAASTGGMVAKRRTWRIELRLKTGVLRRALWVDRDSGLLMKRETYRDDGTLARRERLVKLELPAAVDPESFAAAPAAGPWMPDGFVFLGESGGRRRYSNGLENYDIFPDGGRLAVAGDLAEDDAARVLATAAR
ncbi:MAG: hypothetical protein HY403_05780 [Elusimicrobia bacterium]|nr:hypothetical protein [Elusimicrobiota bacterium]